MEKAMESIELYTPNNPAVDVVLVHGLDGDPVKTWAHTTNTKPSVRTVWPQELLPRILPRARVLSFGYNGNIYRNNSVAGIRGNANSLLAHVKALRHGVEATRPIVLVAHCLGGLIVKQALCFADTDPHHQPIASSTKKIMFFGTPHLGAKEKQWNRLSERYSQLSRSKDQASLLLKAMIRDSDDLAEISEDFCELAPKYPIVTFYENVGWNGTNVPIVDQTSACLQLDSELQVSVEADHLGICRFASEKDVTFMTVWQEIEKVAPTSAEDDPASREKEAGWVRCEIAVEEVDEDQNLSGLEEVWSARVAVKAIESAPTPPPFPWQSERLEEKSQDRRPVVAEISIPKPPATAGTEEEERKKGGKGKRSWSLREKLGSKLGRSGR